MATRSKKNNRSKKNKINRSKKNKSNRRMRKMSRRSYKKRGGCLDKLFGMSTSVNNDNNVPHLGSLQDNQYVPAPCGHRSR